MDTGQLLGQVGVYAAAFGVAAISSLVPIASIEVFLVAITLAGRMPAAPPAIAAVVALAAAGQLLGKLPIYFAASGLGARSARVERLRAWILRRRAPPVAVLAVSALVGLPPFSFAATAAGALAIRPRTFSAVVVVCRGLRFAALVAIAARR